MEAASSRAALSQGKTSHEYFSGTTDENAYFGFLRFSWLRYVLLVVVVFAIVAVLIGYILYERRRRYKKRKLKLLLQKLEANQPYNDEDVEKLPQKPLTTLERGSSSNGYNFPMGNMSRPIPTASKTLPIHNKNIQHEENFRHHCQRHAASSLSSSLPPKSSLRQSYGGTWQPIFLPQPQTNTTQDDGTDAGHSLAT
jgi:hypothetical protein